MELYFRDATLERSCRSRAGRRQRWGSRGALVGRRLAELAALGSLDDAQWLPGVGIVKIDGGSFELRYPYGVRLVLTQIDSYAVSSNGRVRAQRVVLESVIVDDSATDIEGEDV